MSTVSRTKGRCRVGESPRLSRIESELDADEVLRHWLAEAQQFPDLAAYAGWAFGQEGATDPFDRLYEYLGGHDSLLPATADAWAELVERSEALYDAAAALLEADGFEPLDAIRERADAGAQGIAERIVGMVSLETYWITGERDKADAAAKRLLETVTTP